MPGFKMPNVGKARFITLLVETVITYFAPDIPESDAKLIAAGQGPLYIDALDQVPNAAAWKTKPSWFVVSTNDQMLAQVFNHCWQNAPVLRLLRSLQAM